MRALRFVIFSLACGLLLGACGDDDGFSPEDCEDEGGYFVPDSGGGETHRDGCPAGEELIGGVRFGVEGGICCRR
ncbi:hypothetical protein [Sorangium cellulosum]|uniref:hypothetical protein n=1 Tax=Sorangium cellulosum TaxID=56 RepID=UPI0010100A57|nr:hypothetical protein [Sorangium cellulosum]